AGGGLTIAEAVHELESIEDVFKRGVVESDLLAIGLARVGLEEEKVLAGRIGDIANASYPPPPHCLVIPSELHFTEKESVKSYAIESEFVERYSPPNSLGQRVWKYADKCRRILGQLGGAGLEKSYLEMVGTYVEDSLHFLTARDIINSLLAIGYAEGLLDALRIRGEADFQW
ncbi:MAG: DUF357 domain-containing protein, partial [Nitrososphaerota archaeon]